MPFDLISDPFNALNSIPNFFTNSLFKSIEIVELDDNKVDQTTKENGGNIFFTALKFSSNENILSFLNNKLTVNNKTLNNFLYIDNYRIIFCYCLNEDKTCTIAASTETFRYLESNKNYFPDFAKQIQEILGNLFTLDEIKKALEFAFPYSSSRYRFPPKKIKNISEQLKYLVGGMVDNETQEAINVLATTINEINPDVIETYNQFLDVRSNSLSKNKRLNAVNFIHMANRLKLLQKVINRFQNQSFNSASDVVDFVNNNLVDPSAVGAETHFIINFPFQGLNLQRRKEMISLFLDEPINLSFSGFWAGATWDGSRTISAGDVLYTLLITASDIDRENLVYDLENSNKIFNLLNQCDNNDILFNMSIILANVAMIKKEKSENEDDDGKLLLEGNKFYFNMALAKNQTENLKEKEKKIELINQGYYNFSDNPDSYQIDDSSEKYLDQYASKKTLFKPLELIILFAEDDVNSEILKLKKGDSKVLPACIVYLLLKEDTNRAVKFLVTLSTTVIFLPFGVSALVTAIKTASTLGIFVAATDIAVDAAYLTYTTPIVQNSDVKKDLEWIEAFAAIYGLSRLGFALKDVKKADLLLKTKQAFIILSKEAEEFIKRLPYKVVAGVINVLLSKDVQYIVLNKLLVIYTKNGRVLGVMNPEGFMVEMKIITNAGDSYYTPITSTAITEIQAFGKKYTEEIQLFKYKNVSTNKIDLILGTPFKNSKTRDAELVDFIFIKNKNEPPCMLGFPVIDRYLEAEQKIIIYGKREGTGFRWIGIEKFKTELDIRNKLSLIEDFKPSSDGLVGYVFKVKKRIPIRESIAGPLLETKGLLAGQKTTGGAVQYEILIKIDNSNKPIYFEEIEAEKIIIIP